MKWSASVAQIDPPRPVAILLAIVAGFIDAWGWGFASSM
jgi:uncharacterized membrane protein YoaK (UPF0700 family)